MKSIIVFAALLALAFAVPVVMGEEPGAAGPDPDSGPPAKEREKAPPEPLRDPTEPDPGLRPVRPGGTDGQGNPLPGVLEPALPPVALRGFIEVEGRPPAALLQISSAPAILVHAGDRIALGGAENGATGARWFTQVLVKEVRDGTALLVFSPGDKEVVIR